MHVGGAANTRIRESGGTELYRQSTLEAIVRRCVRSERAARAEQGEDGAEQQRGRAALGLPTRRARRVALGARPRARTWCARPPLARGWSEGAARAQSDGRDER